MSSLLATLFSRGPVYVRITRHRLTVREVSSGREYADEPCLAISGEDQRRTIKAVGEAARQALAADPHGLTLVNGFDHPRAMIDDFEVAERTLAYFLRQIYTSTLIRPSPVVILQVTEALAGGLSGLEIRALREIAMGAGARAVHIWDGPDLTDRMISEHRYPSGTWLSDPPPS